MKETGIKRIQAWWGLVLQSLLSHMVAGGLALLVGYSNFLPNSSSSNSFGTTLSWVGIVAAVVLAGTVGLLGTLNLQLGLQALAIRLEQLTDTLSCAPLTPLERYWLLPGDLLARTVSLSTRLSKLVQKEQEFERLREDWQLEASQLTEQEARRSLAARLHDTLKQQIHFISIAAATAQLKLEKDQNGARLALDEVRRYAREAVKQADTLIKDLEPEPLSPYGDLLQVIATESSKIESYGRIEVIQEVPEMLPVTPAIQQGLARVVQLAVANIIRHARASQVRFKVQVAERSLKLEVSDNGRGFDVASTPGNTGLANSRLEVFKLGGDLTILSQPGAGTSLLVNIPLLDPLEASYLRSPTSLFKQWNQQVTNCYTLGGLAIELALLLGGLFGRLLTQVPEWVLVGLLVGLVLSLIFSGYCFFQAWYLSKTSKLDPAITRTPSARAWKRRNFFYLLTCLGLFASAFLPLTVLRFPGWPALDYIWGADHYHYGAGAESITGPVLLVLTFSLLSGLATLVALYQVYHYTRRYYEQLGPTELEYELNLAWKFHQFQLKSSLWFWAITIVYLLGIGFGLPPTVWQWLAAYSLVVFSGLVISEVVKRRFLIRYRQERAVAQSQLKEQTLSKAKEEVVGQAR